jgi:hypothetical protein
LIPCFNTPVTVVVSQAAQHLVGTMVGNNVHRDGAREPGHAAEGLRNQCDVTSNCS